MKAYLVLSFFIGVSVAAPQGYNYQGPLVALNSAQAPVGQYQPLAGPAPVSMVPIPEVSVSAVPTHLPVALVSGSLPILAPSLGPATGTLSASPSISGPALLQTESAAPSTAPEASVSKHFYIHAAPEESAEEAQSQQLSAGPAHKHYRIVFIKAPSQSASATAISLAQAQNEEKTIIYVLTKKTDAAEVQANVQAAKQAASKPEVFFIKYKTPEEAEHAQHQIQAQYDALGGTSEVSDEGIAPVQSFIGALENSAMLDLGSSGQISGADTVANTQNIATDQNVPGVQNIASNIAYLPPTY